MKVYPLRTACDVSLARLPVNGSKDYFVGPDSIDSVRRRAMKSVYATQRAGLISWASKWSTKYSRTIDSIVLTRVA